MCTLKNKTKQKEKQRNNKQKIQNSNYMACGKE